MTRRQGRSPRGKRLVAAVPHGRWKTSTLVAGLRLSGIVAPLVIDHPMNGLTFRAYMRMRRTIRCCCDRPAAPSWPRSTI
jgi:hypothetical protein